MGEHTRGAVRKTVPRKVAPGPAAERRGKPSTGRIITLFIGQSHGFIRLASGRAVFFHRSDVLDGELVKFELLEDEVSGPRALQVERRRPRR